MRSGVVWLASALLVTLVLAGPSPAQPPRDRRGPPDRPDRRDRRDGPGGGLERAVEELRLSRGKEETALAAARSHQDNMRRLTDVAGAGLLLKMKDIVSPEEFKKLRAATEDIRGGRRATTDDVAARLLSFDANKDGKVSKEELPERMQDLLAKGDTNKDGVLDADEIKKLAADPPRDESARRGFGPGFGGRFPGGPGGRGAPGPGLPPRALERAVDDLKLTGAKKEAADAAVKAHREDVRKLTELVRADTLLIVSDVLSAEEVKKFSALLDRPPGPGDRPGPRDGRFPGPPFGRPRPDRP